LTCFGLHLDDVGPAKEKEPAPVQKLDCPNLVPKPKKAVAKNNRKTKTKGSKKQVSKKCPYLFLATKIRQKDFKFIQRWCNCNRMWKKYIGICTSLTKHQIEIHERRYAKNCKICGREFLKTGHYNTHMKLHGEDPKDLRYCYLCKKKFGN